MCASNVRGNRDVAQLGSASALGAEGRWFESSRPDHFLCNLLVFSVAWSLVLLI